jgi:hypothetical protein
MTKIECLKDLYNGGKCFTKGKVYTVEREIKTELSLIDVRLTNDLDEPHVIGHWWANFKIIEHEND